MTTKPVRLLAAGRVHVPDVTRAVVDGDSGRHTVERHGETWHCDCAGFAYRHGCAHCDAVQLITRPPGPDEPKARPGRVPAATTASDL